MGLIDGNIVRLPGARRIMAVLAVSAVLDALCIIVQGVSLGTALSLVWEGAGAAVAGAAARAAGAAEAAGAAGAGGFDWAGIAGGAAVFLAGYAGRQAVSYARARMMDRFARERAGELQARLVSSTYDGGPAFVAAFGSGNVVTATIEGIDRIEDYLEIMLPKAIDLIAIPAVLCIGLFALDWVSGIIALVMLPCIALYMRMLGRNAREAAARQHGAYVRLGNRFIDTVRGIRTLAFFGRSKAAADDVYAASERARTASMKTIRVATLSSLLIDLFRTFALAAIAIMLGFRLMDGGIALAPALAVLIIVPEYFAAIRRFSADFHASLDGKNRLAAVLDMIAWQETHAPRVDGRGSGCEEGADEGQAGAREGCAAGEQAAPGERCAAGTREGCATDLCGDLPGPEPDGAKAVFAQTPLPALCFSDVSYAYLPAGVSGGGKTSGEAAHRALHKLSFRTDDCRRIGIVGVSGSGKSTLARIIAGFAAPTEGDIAVNGLPADLRSQTWRGAVAYIPQNPHIFHGSVHDNIAFYQPDAPRAAVVRAAHAAGLDEVVAALPCGFDTLIGEGGRALSGGQAQRIALARAFLDDARRILVFDEPTAHLDLETEFGLKETMLPLMDGRLVFFATHRLHWMRSMDLLLVLEEGRLVEQGSYDELLARNGAFARLVARLLGTAAPEGVAEAADAGKAPAAAYVADTADAEGASMEGGRR